MCRGFRPEPATGKRGPPKKFAGRVNPMEPDMNFFTLSHRTAELKIYSAIVYGKAFQREINLSIAVFCRKDGTEICRKRYFSTDLPQDGMNIVRFFRAFAVNPNLPKNQHRIRELCNFGLIAA